jgi:transposase
MTKAAHIPTEKASQKQAFEAYYSLGPKRKYKNVAERYGVSVSTIKNWARHFGWQERVEQRETEICRSVADRSRQQGVDWLERQMVYLEGVASRIARDVGEGRAKTSLGDIGTLIEERRKLAAILESKNEGQNGKEARFILYVPDESRHSNSRSVTANSPLETGQPLAEETPSDER